MATNKDIKAYVKTKYGFVPENCWIAHARAARWGGSVVDAQADIGTIAKPCSERKRISLFAALEELEASEAQCVNISTAGASGGHDLVYQVNRSTLQE